MKKADFLFILLFMLLLAAPIPIFFGFRDQIPAENTENQAENEFPRFDVSHYSVWTKNFDKWLTDNLPFKTQFIHWFRMAQYRFGEDFVQSDVIRGEEPWIFYRTTLDNYKGLKRFTDDELRVMRDNVTNFFAHLKGKGIHSLIYIAPDKEQIYPQYMPEKIHRVTEVSAGDQVSEWLSAQTEVPTIYPKDEFQKLANDIPLYFNSDTHWNELGGNIASQQIKNSFSGTEERIETPKNHYFYEEGKDLAKMIGLRGPYYERNQFLIDWEDGITANRTESIDFGTIQRYHSDSPNHKKILVLGDSFAEYYIRSAIHDVSDILFVTFGELSRIDLEAEAPDEFVLMLVERNLPFILQGFF